jgi:magnesium chelatase family protein
MKRPRSRHPASVDPRDLPPGSPYACKDPYVGARVAVGDVAGRIVGCATPPEGKRGRYFAVGEIAPGVAIGRAWRDRVRNAEALRARYEGPDFDLRPKRRARPGEGGTPTAHGTLGAPAPRPLMGLPAPRESGARAGKVANLGAPRRPKASKAAKPARAVAPPAAVGTLPMPEVSAPAQPAGVLAPSFLGLAVSFPTITATLEPGVPSFDLSLFGIGPETIRELRTSVRAAVEQSGFTWPLRRVVVSSVGTFTSTQNLALPIALAVLLATGDVQSADSLNGVLACAELRLSDGVLIGGRGTFLAVHRAAEAGLRAAIVAEESSSAPAVFGPMPVIAANTLRELVFGLNGVDKLDRARPQRAFSSDPPESPALSIAVQTFPPALQWPIAIAAGGGFNMLVIRRPNDLPAVTAGRGMLSVLPPPSAQEAVAITDVASLVFAVDALATERPYRAPHHTVSASALVGSGRGLPGEFALADLGVMVFEDLPEFSMEALDALQETLAQNTTTIIRSGLRVVYPARFRLVASMLPCPCGYLGTMRCSCDAQRMERWLRRLPQKLFEQFDVVVDEANLREMSGHGGTSIAQWRELVARARAAQAARGGNANAGTLHASGPAIAEARLDVPQWQMLRRLRVARVLADMRGEEVIDEDDVLRAVKYTRDPMRAALAAVAQKPPRSR